jgi:limonene 1,2-monooxygenase
MAVRLRHGIFMAPFHKMNENPTLLFQQDMQLIEMLDGLGFHEAWIGEHHSAGMETISSPELFIAAVAERTRNIRLGTGVISLPYHNPLMVADRIVQLDHMTRGRVMFGAGPGLLASDALMLGIGPSVQRDRMAEGLDVILRLFKGEVVTEKTDWYELVEASLHLPPYSTPYPEVCVASAVTPSGGRLAGQYDLGMLCVAAGENAGFNALDVNWGIANEIAASHGRRMDPGRLRLVVNMHLAGTREEAKEQARFGLKDQVDYLKNTMPRVFIPDGVDPVDWFFEQGNAVIGAAGRARLGQLGEHQTLLRAVRALRDSAFREVQRAAAELLPVGDQAPGRAHREAQERRAGHVRQARSRMVAAWRAGHAAGGGQRIHVRLSG